MYAKDLNSRAAIRARPTTSVPYLASKASIKSQKTTQSRFYGHGSGMRDVRR